MRRIPAHLLFALTLGASFALAAPAGAFCGFYVGGAESSLYNDATMVVMMREGTRTVLSMQNNYQGPPEDFAMVVPVPTVLSEENVKTLPSAIFERVDRLAAPRLVEYWEQDPCMPQPDYRSIRPSGPRRSSGSRARRGAGGGDLGVTVEAEFAVGEYDIVILGAEDSSGLDTWLRREGYHIPDGAEPALRPYVQAGTKFFVAKVDAERVTFEDGRAVLSPLRVHYESAEFSLPVRLGMINSSGTQDLIVHILARNMRYETANYPNVFIPTNIEVKDEVRQDFGAFYAALFDRTLERNPGAVVTEYSWQSSSCDPCPGPTLTMNDIETLGGDVVLSHGAGSPPPPPRPTGAVDPFQGLFYQRPPGRRPIGRRVRRRGNPFTLTRLHYRYGRGELGEDLVFRGAQPANGGRGVPDPKGVMSREVSLGGANNFQGRYAILHRWEGELACESPTRGRWGGPPGGGAHSPSAATNLGAVRRRDMRLSDAVAVHLPELDIEASDAPPAPPAPEGAPSIAPAEDDLTQPGASAPAAETEESRGCGGCGAAGGMSGGAPLMGLLLAGMRVFRRRRA